MPIHVPMVDVHTIGAGGGSIAYVDDAGMLQVGPESAGATPGPICYGRGGERATITDANLVLGRLSPASSWASIVRSRWSACTRSSTRRSAAARARSRSRGGSGHPHRQRPDGRRDPHGEPRPRPRPARLRAVRVRRRGPAARGRARARARDSQGASSRRDRGSPTRSAAWSPTCATTSSAPSTGCFPKSTDALVRRILDEQIAEGRATIERERVAVDAIEFVHRADMQFQGQSHILTVALPAAGRDPRRPAASLRGGLLAALRGRAAGDPAGARQPAHRGDRRAAARCRLPRWHAGIRGHRSPMR